MNDPVIHAVVAAQFGDLEFDVGKSVRWTQWYADHVHVTDISTGEQRFWVVNWSLTFPNAAVDVTPFNFFGAPVKFRKEQWRLYQTKFEVGDDDWVLWVDAHEGLSFDITSLPDDYAASPFRSWVYREVARAEGAGKDRVVVPFFVFVANKQLQNITVPGTGSPEHDVPDTQQSVSVPYYVAKQGLTRLFKGSVLKNPAFNWASLDQVGTPDANVKMQLIDYAYAHWQYLDVDDEGVVPPISEANDMGFKMRKLISRVRPFADFPFAAWNRDDSPVGLPGPWCKDITYNTNPGLEIVEETPHTPAHASMAGLMTPLYDTYFRLNLRDGVWYEDGASGNIPLVWDSATGKWVTNYDPTTWADEGVASWTGEAEPVV